MIGWVSFHRQIMKWEWYTDSNTFRLFFHLVLSANHEHGRWKGNDVQRGQLITSSDKLAAQLELSRQQIRTALKKLESTNEITIKATSKFTIVTVEKYDFYQDDARKTTSKVTSKITNKQPTSNQQVTTNNNKKNNNNENNKDIVDYLNSVCSTTFRSSGKKTKDLIQARINEGFTTDDFKKVIDIKSKEWLNSDMSKYLRPETLFSNKFEGYLNQKADTKIDNKNKFNNFDQRQKYSNDELERKLGIKKG